MKEGFCDKHLQRGEIRHNVKFTEVSLTGIVFVKTMRGEMVNTSGGTKVELGGNNPDTIYLDSAPGHSELMVPTNEQAGKISFAFKIQPSQVSFAYGKRILSIPTMGTQAGFVEISGGNGNYGFAQLTISGKMDNDWANTFFAEPAAPLEQ